MATDHASPVVEPLGARRVRLTLVHDDPDAVGLNVVGGIAGLDPTNTRMERGEDGLWRKSWDAPDDLRTVYWFARDGELDEWKRWRRDSWNPRTYVYPADPELPDDDELVGSLLELPAAPPFEWSLAREGVPAGSLVEERFRSGTLGNERRVWLYTPPNHERTDDLRLLVVFDGFAYTTLVPAVTVIDNLVAAARIPPLVAVLPDSLDQETRTRELPCHRPFVDFLTDELLPWVQTRTGTTPDPRRVVVAGSSFGGLAAAFCALERPDVFGNVLSQSGSFPWAPEGEEPELLPRLLAGRDRAAVRWYVDVGRLETRPAWRGTDRPSALASNRHLRDLLQACGYDFTYREFPGGHDYLWWRETLAWGLLDLLGSD